MRFERSHEKLLPMRLFLLRFARWTSVAAAVVAISLAVGICGYHYLGAAKIMAPMHIRHPLTAHTKDLAALRSFRNFHDDFFFQCLDFFFAP